MRGVERLLIACLLVFAMVLPTCAEEYISGSTGADGAFEPSETNTVVDLPPDGILNYTTVNIPAGVTVTFKKNEMNTPVYMLATGDVIISGTLHVSADNAIGLIAGKGGPGGFDGGNGGIPAREGLAGGGPGGGKGGCLNCVFTGRSASGGIGGLYNYLNDELVNIIGGSGAGGGGSNSGWVGGGGGGGGGALLIASSSLVTLNGTINARGSNGADGTLYNNAYSTGGGGGGSGGAVRVIAPTITGTGVIYAIPGTAGCYRLCGSAGGNGKIRFEAYDFSFSKPTNPTYLRGYPEPVFHLMSPSMRIVSIGGSDVAADAKGRYTSPDIILPKTVSNPVTVVINANNVPSGSSVNIVVISESTPKIESVGVLDGTDEASTAEVSVEIPRDRSSIIYAVVTIDTQVASYAPETIDGEKVASVQIKSTLGGKMEIIYVTETGREIPAS